MLKIQYKPFQLLPRAYELLEMGTSGWGPIPTSQLSLVVPNRILPLEIYQPSPRFLGENMMLFRENKRMFDSIQTVRDVLIPSNRLDTNEWRTTVSSNCSRTLLLNQSSSRDISSDCRCVTSFLFPYKTLVGVYLPSGFING